MTALSRTLISVANICCVLPAFATPSPLPLANPSFEDFHITPGSYRAGDIDGWRRQGGTQNNVGIQSTSPTVFLQSPENSALPSTADGTQFAFLNPAATEGEEVILYQTLGALRTDTRYTLTVAVGNRIDKNHTDKILLELRNGDDVKSPVLSSASNPTPPENGSFADHSVSFATGPRVSGNLTIAIRNQTKSQVVFDNARLTIEAANNEAPRP